MSYLFSFIKFTIALIFTIIFFEYYFRFSEVFLPPFVQNDFNLGRVLKPNANINIVRESFFIGRVNKYGYLGTPYISKKDSCKKRIALIGDSFIEGFQVKEEYHLRTVLESSLNRETNSENYEVLNFGISGLDFRKMFILYQSFAKKYNPDMVLFFVNDSDFLSDDKNLGPRLTLEKNNKLKTDYSFRNSKEFQSKSKINIFRGLSVYSLFKADYAAYASGKTSRIIFNKLTGFDNNIRPNLTATVVQSTPDSLYHLNALVLNQLSGLKKEGVDVLIIPIRDLSEDYNLLIKKSGLQRIDLNKIYSEMQTKGINPFYWEATNMEGHWNNKAHEYIGKYLAGNIISF